MKEYLDLIEQTLDAVLPQTRPDILFSAMRYAVGTGGKRIRPLVCLASAVAVGGKAEDAKYPAAAIELLHNYTLIHDDLPAMDNDRERRGKPTVWVKFGEANAILAGDALLALAYRVAAKAPRNVAAIVDVLGEKGVGVVQGQVEDVRRETEDGGEDAKYPAAAIELLHNYTLIHDDLPAMDNDRERRGKPTVWVRFGEANAILAGDALLALAYRVAAKAPRNVAAIVDVLGEKGVGVVQGQVEDVRRETLDGSQVSGLKSSSDDFIYRHKTADLFIAAAAMGGLAGGGSEADVAALKEFALNLGLAFQYEDDLLDGDGLYPPEETERRVHETTAAAIAALDRLPGDTTFLRDLAQKLIGRKV